MTIEQALRITRLWLRVKQSARAGIQARILIEERELRRDEQAGRVEHAKDRRLVIEELRAALQLTETSVSRFAAAMNDQQEAG